MDDSLGRAPLFPLPHGSLLPGELLPLHVFEPRYRRMLEVIRERDKLLAIATIVPGWEREAGAEPPLGPVVGIGRVVRDRQNEDGTSDIAVHGLMRGVIAKELDNTEPFREAAVQLRPEETGHPAEAYRLTRHLLQGLDHVLGNKHFRYDLTESVKLGSLVDRIAGGLQLAPDLRARVMQAVELEERVDLLLELVRGPKRKRRFLELLPSLSNYHLGLDEG